MGGIVGDQQVGQPVFINVPDGGAGAEAVVDHVFGQEAAGLQVPASVSIVAAEEVDVIAERAETGSIDAVGGNDEAGGAIFFQADNIGRRELG